MKLVDALKLGFTIRRYKGKLVFGGTPIRDKEGFMRVKLHEGFESETKKQITSEEYLDVNEEVNPEEMVLILSVKYSDVIADSLAISGVAPITRDDITKTKWSAK